MSARRHLGAQLGAQSVDQDEAGLGLDVPKSPAVAGFETLRQRPGAMDRPDRVAEPDRAGGADQRRVATARIDQNLAGADEPALDERRERHPRRLARGEEG